MSPAINTFIDNIDSIPDPDYGDFMRKANIYLNELLHDLAPLGEDVKNKIAQMQLYIQYYPTWDVESTREKILKDAHYLDELVMAHQQDWESPASAVV